MNNKENREKDIYHDDRNIEGCNFEFLIRRVRDFEFSDDFEILKQDSKEILTPNSLEFTEFKLLDTEYCKYKIMNSKVWITSEFAGIQIVIKNKGIEREIIKQVLEEIRSNIEKYSNYSAQIFEV